MIRVYNYDEHNEYNEFESFLKLIEKDCKPFLKLLYSLEDIESYFNAPMPLFLRGIKGETENLIKKKVRKDRRPLDSVNQVDSNLIDSLFYDKMGVRPRSEGIFTTVNQSMAYSYGEVYIIFPIGEFDYVTSNTWVDMIDAWSYYYDVLNNYNVNGDIESKVFLVEYGEEENHKVPRKWIEHVLEDYGKNDDKIRTATKEGQEVIFICDEYYAIKVGLESKQLNKIIEWLDEKN